MSKVPFIKNPLTIIGIFSTVTEGLCIYALPKLTERNQDIFIWFVIGFPVLLLLLFFYTLVNYHTKLYSPDDFANKDNDFAKLFFQKNPSNEISIATSVKDSNNYFKPFVLEEFYPKENGYPKETEDTFKIINYIFSELDKTLPKEKLLYFDYEAQSPSFYSFTYVIKPEFLKENTKKGKSYILWIHFEKGKVRAALAGYDIEFDDTENSIISFILENIQNSIN